MKTSALLTAILITIRLVHVKAYSEGIVFTGLEGSKSLKPVIVGKSFIIDCNVNNENVEKISLYRRMPNNVKKKVVMDGKVYKQKEKNRFELTLTSINQAGMYLCVAELYGTKYEKQVPVIVIGLLEDITPLPEVTSKFLAIEVDQQLIVSCQSKGPRTLLTWYKGGKKLTDDRRISIINSYLTSGVSSKLTINKALRNDSGIYRCKATTSLKPGYFSFVDVKVAVKEATPVVSKDTFQIVKVGSKVVLDCSLPNSNAPVEFFYQTHRGYLREIHDAFENMTVEKERATSNNVTIRNMGIYICISNGVKIKKILLFVMQDPENVCGNFKSKALKYLCEQSNPDFKQFLKKLLGYLGDS
ncbi:contactin-5-like [Rhopilema esculentum]|uniref:contactin-5-like n=1 Tax=Rhopilema esculentum TaxID=499914 RepID=UPI0031D63205